MKALRLVLVILVVVGCSPSPWPPKGERWPYDPKDSAWRLVDAAYNLGRVDQHAIDCALLETDAEDVHWWASLTAPGLGRTMAYERHMQAEHAMTVVATGERNGGNMSSFGRSVCEAATWSGHS